jgi:hypothetical protein
LNLETVGKKPHSYLLKPKSICTKQKRRKEKEKERPNCTKLKKGIKLHQAAYPGN